MQHKRRRRSNPQLSPLIVLAKRSESNHVELMASSRGFRPHPALLPLFIFLHLRARACAAARAQADRQTGSLHVTAVQSDPLSALFIKRRRGVSEVQ